MNNHENVLREDKMKRLNNNQSNIVNKKLKGGINVSVSNNQNVI